MRTRNLFLGVLAAASLASCSDDQVTGISTGTNEKEITYSVVTNKATRATLYDNDSKPAGFYVWAVNSSNEAYINKDEIVKLSDGSYTDNTATRYWPTSGTLDFYATNYDASLSVTNPAIDYTVGNDPDSQEDLLYAVVKSQSSGTVNLNFRHALSQIVFQVKNEDAQLYVEITGVGIHRVYNRGTFAFPSVATSDQQTSTDYATSGVGTWSSLDGSAEYSFDLTSNAVELEGETEATALTSGETALLLLPQRTTLTGDHWNSAETNAYFTLACAIYNMAGTTYDEDNDIQLYTGTVYFPIAISWEAGMKYTYTFDFGGSGSDNPGGETEDDTSILSPITFSVAVDSFTEADDIEEDVAVE